VWFQLREIFLSHKLDVIYCLENDWLLANLQQNGDNRSFGDGKPRIIDDESIEKSKMKLAEISEPSQCCSLKLTDNLLSVKVSVLSHHNAWCTFLTKIALNIYIICAHACIFY